ncbi:putative quinol monooxygenase [Brenneria izbisi]|uniref:Antibiotic biosynthesis monooxygenase n=1 Tax=Brenneria izbisi TaxID=2939450 RepID=A0AA42C2P6_9GAMM|nr:antibiotic biosynthesis monooxygenase family protein [Brenneria izbisi]MCV9879623.1 antibiotic biosynthesis monooxygenase [Brenneria izbisi]MCV9883012.1 antibiotic biosynthesis monooxygenase [Brenneria izbisi]
MNNDITCVFTLTLAEGKFPAFRDLVAKIVTATHQEPGTLSYVYSVSEDEKSAHIVERYQADALVSHVDNTFAPFAEEFLSLVTITSLTVYGDPDAAIKERLDPFGAVYLKPFAGFTR